MKVDPGRRFTASELLHRRYADLSAIEGWKERGLVVQHEAATHVARRIVRLCAEDDMICRKLGISGLGISGVPYCLPLKLCDSPSVLFCRIVVFGKYSFEAVERWV